MDFDIYKKTQVELLIIVEKCLVRLVQHTGQNEVSEIRKSSI